MSKVVAGSLRQECLRRLVLMVCMWHGPDCEELASLSYCETKVINLARLYVSVKRIFLDRRSYATTRKAEAVYYHQKNVVAYAQSADAALTALGMRPQDLAKMIQVQFIGEDRKALFYHVDLSVSVQKLRLAFRWLSINSWLWMEATRHHALWQTQLLDVGLESLLDAYAASVGGTSGGTPAELVQCAARITGEHAAMHAAGPANCTGADDSLRPEDVDVQGEDPACEGNQCAAAVDGGVDEISPVQLWDMFVGLDSLTWI